MLPGAMPSVELHCHSASSFLDGASTPEDLVLRAKELGYRALALTDTNGLYGAMEFAKAAGAWGLHPITGAEVMLAGGGHLTLLVETAQGYANLCRLLTHAHLDHERGSPRVEPEVLARHAAGLIALSGCRRGEVPALVAAGRFREAEAAARRLLACFGPGNVFVELQDHAVKGDRTRNRRLVDLARHARLGVVATGNVHYAERRLHRAHDVLTALRHRRTLEASHRERRATDECFLRPPGEQAARFAWCPEAVRATLEIAARCRFDPARDLAYRFPDAPVPPGETQDSWLRKLCEREAVRRYGRITPEVRARLEEELRLIAHHRLAGFFLLHHEVVRLANQVAEEVRGRPSLAPPGRGRGSSVGSLVCYLIGLSPIDPLAYDLFLGRFLNDALEAVPDIDLDVPREVREPLLARLSERFGREHVGLVCTFPTFRLRLAIREVGKVLGLPAADLARVARAAETWDAGSVGEELARLLPDRHAARPWRLLAELCADLAGLPRHVSQHPGGVVISAAPLVELVPLQQSGVPGRHLLQWDKESCADARFVKLDVLALGALSAVEDCLHQIEAGRGRRVDLARIDCQDPAVFDALGRGDAVGVFQLESRAQAQVLPQTRPRTLHDLTVQVARSRPGPVGGGAVRPSVARRLGREPVRYDHPRLVPVLRETLGVIVYQEQVLQVAMALAGFTAGQAETLRRAMSRQRSPAAMAALREAFLAGCRRRGVPRATAERVFAKLAAFAGYGFPKAHAAAFGLLAYQTAWLKVHYPAEFLCGLLNAQPMGCYPPATLVADARRHGVAVLRPDVNRSDVRCTVEGGDVRLGLGSVRGLGEAAARAVVAERARGGPYRSLPDLARRLPALAREALERLVLAGACDGFGLGRRALLWQLGLVLRPRGRQLALPLPTAQDAVALPGETAWDRLGFDHAGLGLSPDDHPLRHLRPALGEGVVPAARLAALPAGLRVRVAGLVVARQRPPAARGTCFLLLEDETGLANAVLSPAVYAACREAVRLAPAVLVEGRVERRDRVLPGKDGAVSLRVASVRRLPGVTE